MFSARLALRPCLVAVLAVAGATLAMLAACGDDSGGGSPNPDAGSQPPGSSSGNDAATESETGGGPTSGCAAYAGAVFCDDFETAPLATNWPLIQYTGENVSPTITTANDAVSPSHVLHASASVGDGGGGGVQQFSLVKRALPSTAQTQTLHVAFSARIASFTVKPGGPAHGPSPDIQLNVSPSKSIVGACVVRFQAQNPSATEYAVTACNKKGPSDGPTATVPFTVNTWQRIKLDVDFLPTDAGTGTVSVSVDGKAVTSAPFSGSPNTKDESYTGSIILGAYAFGDVPSTVVDLDDVVITQN